MFRSLRFRLPALFLLGVVVSGLIASVIALRLFQSYVIDRSKKQLRREAIGLTEVFVRQAINANDTATTTSTQYAGSFVFSCSAGKGIKK